MKIKAGLMWTQWYIGIWWWPVRKDLAFGINLGPLYIQWVRSRNRHA